jgi:hypothetical protein
MKGLLSQKAIGNCFRLQPGCFQVKMQMRPAMRDGFVHGNVRLDLFAKVANQTDLNSFLHILSGLKRNYRGNLEICIWILIY